MTAGWAWGAGFRWRAGRSRAGGRRRQSKGWLCAARACTACPPGHAECQQWCAEGDVGSRRRRRPAHLACFRRSSRAQHAGHAVAVHKGTQSSRHRRPASHCLLMPGVHLLATLSFSQTWACPRRQWPRHMMPLRRARSRARWQRCVAVPCWLQLLARGAGRRPGVGQQPGCCAGGTPAGLGRLAISRRGLEQPAGRKRRQPD